MKKILSALAIICTVISVNSAKADTPYHSLKNTALAYGLIDNDTLQGNLRVYENMAKQFVAKTNQFSKIAPSDAKAKFAVKLELLRMLSKSSRFVSEQLETIPGSRLLPAGSMMVISGMNDRLIQIGNLVKSNNVTLAQVEVQKELTNIQALQKD